MRALADIGTVRAGYTLRKDLENHSGDAFSLIQIQNVSDDGELDLRDVKPVLLPDAASKSVLRSGDILFPARGRRNTASVYRGALGRALAGYQFFIITLKDELVIPEYLAWVLNQPPANKYFEMHRSGSHVQMITKSALDSFPVAIPSLEDQKRIVALHHLSLKERRLTEQLAEKKFHAVQAICLNIAAGTSEAAGETAND